ncbi:site-specific integrase [Brachybacterium sacelli]|uniref:Integrase n=1 Tax=Brachybacterium sacelli TaxID=173364 RepID=A0ABS4X5R5_9MICO|nr:site-specific integrase [Brachybacterium sacelli]MBP2383802.1 integrase [Brachybacterium sacelli]
MTRRKTAPGDFTKITYYVRTDRGAWQSADPSDSSLSRAKRGRQWRARTRMGLADGTTTKLSRSATTPAAALAALELVIAAERRRTSGPEASVPTLGELVDWAVVRIDEGRDPSIKSSNSQRTYLGIAYRWAGYSPSAAGDDEGRRSHIRRTREYTSPIYGVAIDRLTPADLADEVERVENAGGAGSLPQLRAIWRKAMARGIARRHINSDPAAGLKLPSRNATRGKRVYSNGSTRPRDNSLAGEHLAELRLAVRKPSPRQRLDVSDLIVLGSYTGLRIAEANSLRWVDVYLADEDSYLSVQGQVFGSGADRKWEPKLKTESSQRTVPLPPAAADLLRFRQANALKTRLDGSATGPGSDFVFPAQMGGVPDLATASKAVRRTLDRAGFPWVTFHTLRRTVERQLMDAGVDARVIMAVMGHDPATSWSAYVDRNVDVSAVAGIIR